MPQEQIENEINEDWFWSHVDWNSSKNVVNEPMKVIAHLTEAICREPDNVDFYEWRAFVYESIEDFQSEINDLTEAIRLEPDDPGYYERRAFAYKENKDYQSAINDLSEAIRLKPDEVVYYFHKIHFYEEIEDYQSVFMVFAELMRIEPDVANYYFWRATFYEKVGNGQSAIMDLTEAIRLEPQPEFYKLRAKTLEEIGDLTKAEEMRRKEQMKTGKDRLLASKLQRAVSIEQHYSLVQNICDSTDAGDLPETLCNIADYLEF